MKTVNDLIINLKNRTTTETLFNPFNQLCSKHDLPNAIEIRQHNLELLLNTHLDLGTQVMWLFEAPSYLGMRRSGAPFINEGQFEEIQALLSIKIPFQKATHTEAKTAMTSKMAWKVAKELDIKPLIWESMLFHPHRGEDSMTNRKPTKQELLDNKDILIDVLELMRPKKIVAVGRTAEESLKILDSETPPMRIGGIYSSNFN